MVIEYKWDEAKIILWCESYDSDAYIGCKLSEKHYFNGWKNNQNKPMAVEVMLNNKLYASGDEVKLIGKPGYFRLSRDE